MNLGNNHESISPSNEDSTLQPRTALLRVMRGVQFVEKVDTQF